jgi:hypothetical protein
MIYLEQNKMNTISLRLFDRRINSDSYFMFHIIGKDLDFLYLCYDYSPFECSYNLFKFNLDPINGFTVNNIEGSLKLEGGHYKYKVYEKTGWNFDMSNVIQVIEEDILMVQLERSVNSLTQKDIYY